MKGFKKIYYICISLVAIVLFVLSIASIRLGGGSNNLDYQSLYSHIEALTAIGQHNHLTPVARDEAIDYIVRTLKNSGIQEADHDDDDIGYDRVGYKDGQPSFVVQRTEINQETNDALYNDTGKVFVNKVVNNIVVAFASSQPQSNTVVFNTSYDTAINQSGAMSVNADVAVMLDTIKDIKSNNITPSNNLVFIFGEDYQSNLGLYAYANQFGGFGGVSTSTRLSIGMHGFGTSGSMDLYQTSGNNTKLLSTLGLGGVGGGSLVSHLYGSSNGLANTLSFNFGYANFGNFGDSGFTKSPLDTTKGITKSTVEAKANLLSKSVNKLMSADVSDLSASSDAGYFSYLGGMITMPIVVSMVLGVLIFMLAILSVIAIVRAKSSIKQVVKSLFVTLLTLAGVFVIVLGLYYFFGFFLLTAFGVVTTAALSSFVFYNTGVLIAFVIIVFAVYNALLGVVKPLFNVKSIDIARSNVLIFGILSIVLAFATPTISYPFVILSFLQMLALALTNILRNKFRIAHSMDIERLFLCFVPVIITLPITLPAIIGAMSILPMYMYALVGVGVALMMGSILPYFGMLRPKLESLFAKLPSYNVRYVRDEVVSKTDDEGIVTNETVTKLTTQKRKFKYHNYILTSILVIAFAVVLFVSSTPAAVFGARVDSAQYHDIYNNALILSWEQDGTIDPVVKWQVKDKNVFKYFDNEVDGFRYDSDSESYTLDVPNLRDGFAPPIKSSTDSKSVSYTPFNASLSQIVITAHGASNITEFVFTAAGTEYKYANTNALEDIEFELPYNFGNAASIDVVAKGEGSVAYDYVQYCYNKEELNHYEEWDGIQSYLNDKGIEGLNGGLVFKIK